MGATGIWEFGRILDLGCTHDLNDMRYHLCISGGGVYGIPRWPSGYVNRDPSFVHTQDDIVSMIIIQHQDSSSWERFMSVHDSTRCVPGNCLYFLLDMHKRCRISRGLLGNDLNGLLSIVLWGCVTYICSSHIKMWLMCAFIPNVNTVLFPYFVSIRGT